MLMEKARCPNCNSLEVKRHCKSPKCVWFICHCETTLVFKYLVFDRSGRVFLEKVKW